MMKIDPVLGIPVEYREGYGGISEARGIGRWERIVVGPKFLCFPPREQQALLLHEVGHRKLKHLEKRLRKLWLLFISPRSLARLCIEQEYEADRFVRACGFGMELAQAFMRVRPPSDPRSRLVDVYFHPPREERILRLQAGG